MDSIDHDFLCYLLDEKYTHAQISEILKQQYPGQIGFSVSSIEKYCKQNGLSSRISQAEVNEMVRVAVDEVLWSIFIYIFQMAPFWASSGNTWLI